MDLRHLRYFVILAEELHFGRAAARLGISQPPLSQRIRALERELGATLLKRTSRRTELTDAGRLFFVEAQATLARAEHARDVARRAELGEIGELHVGFTPSVPLTATFRDVIQRFRAEYPFVRLVLHEMATQQQVEALADGRLQVGFLRTSGARPFSADALALKDFGHEELVLVLRRDHGLAQSRPDDRIAPACLAGEALVVFPREIGGSTYDQIVTVCRAAGFEPKIAQEAREVVTLIGLVSAGLGLALMATTFASILPDGLTTRRLKAPAPTAATWLAHRMHDESPLTTAFVALVRGGRLARAPQRMPRRG